MADDQYNKLQDEIKKKVNESIRLSTENLDMHARINESQNNKEELMNLLREKQSVMKKINMMKSLNEKYTDQYEELTGEKIRKKKKKKNKKNKKKKGDASSSTASTTTEHSHCHDHDHDHDHDDSDEGEEEDEHHCCCGHDHHH